ncbi:MAG: replication-associated recombination protein A [Helicobacter sp.]|uniref:replication-associated recombination protein A n=1 Tax=Helicobacter sp. TaxID=218 RepID=UPI002A918E87|nr:replication-associated recombination protein A [Helicobacter sp.]MDY5950680.1 replication-associated recombination protein A [Helicobacter sp.]
MRNLAYKFRPTTLENFIGQKHLLAQDAPLRIIIEKNIQDSNMLPNLLFFGPPGSGKTSLAHIIATLSKKTFLSFNATNFKLDSLKKELSLYEHTMNKPLLFIDEVHRLNIAQQEFLLPILEKGQVAFIGASTENPFFTLSPALRSRSFLFELKALQTQDFEELYNRVLKAYPPKHSFDSIKSWLLSHHNGDCRAFLNLLDIALDIDSKQEVSVSMLQSLVQNAQGVKSQNTHYDYISALIKSIRGSDENAALYYLACLIQAGENPEFIARRLVILASEDIGNANPNALNLSVSTMQAVSKIGYPEARIILSQCVIYLACSPKSNTAYTAINHALEDTKIRLESVPSYLKTDAKGYKYPHDFGGFVKQIYHHGKKYVFLKNIGFEKTLQEWLVKIRNSNTFKR